MTRPIRLLHLADLHLGYESYGKTDAATGLSARALDYLARLDEAIAFAAAESVDLVVFTGDAFQSRNPNPTYQREFAKRMRQLATLAPLILLAGDHDLPLNVARASPLDLYETLATPGIRVAREYGVERWQCKSGDLIVAAAPYPLPSRLLPGDALRGKTAPEIDAALKQALGAKLEAMARQAESLSGGSLPRLLIGHFSVRGAEAGSETRFLPGRDIALELDAFTGAGWDYVALGHRHRHQNLSAGRADSPPVVYAGGLERMDFDEASLAKGFCCVELARGATTWRFVEVEARKRQALTIDCRDEENPTRTALEGLGEHDLEGAIVRLEILLKPESETRFTESAIQAALRRANVFHVAGISKAVEREAATRLGADADGLSELALLERYFEDRGLSEERREALLARARGIMAGRDPHPPAPSPIKGEGEQGAEKLNVY